jgi:hypothetical protein
VIDWEREDFTACGERFDVVFGACRPLLVEGGVYVSTDLGPMAQNPLLGLASPLFDSLRGVIAAIDAVPNPSACRDFGHRTPSAADSECSDLQSSRRPIDK